MKKSARAKTATQKQKDKEMNDGELVLIGIAFYLWYQSSEKKKASQNSPSKSQLPQMRQQAYNAPLASPRMPTPGAGSCQDIGCLPMEDRAGVLMKREQTKTELAWNKTLNTGLSTGASFLNKYLS